MRVCLGGVRFCHGWSESADSNPLSVVFQCKHGQSLSAGKLGPKSLSWQTRACTVYLLSLCKVKLAALCNFNFTVFTSDWSNHSRPLCVLTASFKLLLQITDRVGGKDSLLQPIDSEAKVSQRSLCFTRHHDIASPHAEPPFIGNGDEACHNSTVIGARWW